MKVQDSSSNWLKNEVIPLQYAKVIRCHGKTYTPELVLWFKVPWTFLTIVLGVWLFYIWALIIPLFEYHYLLPAGLIAIWLIIDKLKYPQRLFTALFGQRVDIVVLHFREKTFIKVGGWFRYKNYDAFEKIEFHIEQHSKADLEELKRMLNPPKKPQVPYYGRSFQLFMYNGEARLALASFFEDQDAPRILKNRLEQNMASINKYLINQGCGND